VVAFQGVPSSKACHQHYSGLLAVFRGFAGPACPHPLACNQPHAVLVVASEVHKSRQNVFAYVLRLQRLRKRCQCLQVESIKLLTHTLKDMPCATTSRQFAIMVVGDLATHRAACGDLTGHRAACQHLSCCTPNHGSLVMAQLEERCSQLGAAGLLHNRRGERGWAVVTT